MKLKSLECLKGTKFLNFYEAKYDDNDKERPYYFVSRWGDPDGLVCVKNNRNESIRPNAIEAFTYIDDGCDNRYIIMIEEFRLALNSTVYSFPAGLVEPGETAYNALVREVEEEVGGCVETVKFLQNYPLSMCAGLTDESNMLAIVKLDSVGEQHLDYGEHINVVKFTPDELYNKIRNNEIQMTASGLFGATLILNKMGKNINSLFE